MTHPLTANLGTSNFNTAAITNDSLITNPLVLATGTFPVLGRSEDAFIEQAVPLRF
jgi:hypothetical protein